MIVLKATVYFEQHAVIDRRAHKMVDTHWGSIGRKQSALNLFRGLRESAAARFAVDLQRHLRALDLQIAAHLGQARKLWQALSQTFARCCGASEGRRSAACIGTGSWSAPRRCESAAGFCRKARAEFRLLSFGRSLAITSSTVGRPGRCRMGSRSKKIRPILALPELPPTVVL